MHEEALTRHIRTYIILISEIINHLASAFKADLRGLPPPWPNQYALGPKPGFDIYLWQEIHEKTSLMVRTSFLFLFTAFHF